MGWDKGRYYTRSRKVAGQVIREYVGIGPVAKVAAQMDAIKSQEREAKRAERLAMQSTLDAIDGALVEFDQLVQLVTRAALVAAGYRQHHRGEWRKARVQNH